MRYKVHVFLLVTFVLSTPSLARDADESSYAMGFWTSSGELGYEYGVAPQVGVHLLAEQPTYEYLIEQEVAYLTNLERVQRGLMPLKRNDLLDQAARLHAEDMRDQDYFSHISLDGREPWDRMEEAGYDWQRAAENIAAGYRTAPDVVSSWMTSEGHRRNILDPGLREIGVGFAQGGGTYGRYWVQVFGTSDAYPVVIENEIYETRSRTVHLAIYGEGYAETMRISNEPNFRDAKWIPFSSSVTWDLLPGTGTRTVYVQLKTASGVRLPVQSDSVELVESLEMEPTPTLTPRPTATPTPTYTPSPTPVPSPTPTPTVESLPTPTSVPAALVPLQLYEFNSLTGFNFYPGGFSDAPPGELVVGSLPADAMFEGATDGLGLRFIVDPGEVSLLLGPVIEVGGDLTLLRCSVRTTGPGVQIALGALDAALDGSIATTILVDSSTTTDVWRRITITYNPPHGRIMPLIQAANLSSRNPVTCYVDRLEVFRISRETVLTGRDIGAGPETP